MKIAGIAHLTDFYQGYGRLCFGIPARPSEREWIVFRAGSMM
jgi:hypothetical protein